MRYAKAMVYLLQSVSTINITKRCAGTFNRLSGKDLWNSAAPDTRRTGRGKRTKVRKKEDFSASHIYGEGSAGILWPGLNLHVHGKPYQRNEKEQEEFLEQQKLLQQAKVKNFNQPVRGWTGGRFPGIKLGPPDPVEGQNFEGFESIIMSVARVSHMNMKMGRVYSIRSSVAVGNGNGLVGVGGATSSTTAGALRKARNNAANRLVFVERLDDRTVYEDIYVNHHRTWLSIKKQPEGYGLRCHRALKDMCKLIGFKDIYIKATGSTTMLNLLKCFVKGVLLQETYQQKADRLGYNVVEFDELRHNYPVLLASPSGETKTAPFDDYEEYLNQELIWRDIKRRDFSGSSFANVIASNNRGSPTPSSVSRPLFLENISNLKID